MQKHNLFLGVTLSLGSTFLYSIMSALVKGYADILPPTSVIIFLQSLVSLIWMLPFVFLNKGSEIKKIVYTKHPGLNLLRAFFSVTIIFTLYYAVMYIPLVNAMLLANTTPLIVPFIGFLFFSQKINHKLWLPVLIGYIGVAIILNPDSHFFEAASLLALLSALALAFTIQVVSKLARTDSTKTIMFYFLLFSTLITAVIALPFWQPLSYMQWKWIILIGSLYFISQYLGNASMQFANAQLISALMYANVLYTAIFSVLIWNTIPNVGMAAGMLLVVAGGIGCIWVEYKQSHPKQDEDGPLLPSSSHVR